VNELGPEFDGEIRQRVVGVDPASDAVTRFQHDNLLACVCKVTGSRQTGHPRAYYEGKHTTPEVLRLQYPGIV
jgi:hypothetical protein